MRAELCAAVLLFAAPVAAQRGVIDRVTVSPSPARAGTKVSITVTGTNPCGAVRIDYGDGTEAITHPLTQVPATIEYTYSRPGQFRVRAEGMGNCDGDVRTSLRVLPAPEPPQTEMRFREMDENRDGVITRSEWRGSMQAFRANDLNSDGVLSGEELRPGRADERRPQNRRELSEAFDRMDGNRNGVITTNEWPRAEPEFRRLDADGDGVLTRREYLEQDTAASVPASVIVVDARRRWTETGVALREGEWVRVEATGTVQLSGDRSDQAGPDGARTGRMAASAPLNNRVAGALIARIGESAPIFVGASQSFRAPASGMLVLGVNDDYLDDNRGEFRVSIERGRRDR